VTATGSRVGRQEPEGLVARAEDCAEMSLIERQEIVHIEALRKDHD
jgi:hypothetical protein